MLFVSDYNINIRVNELNATLCLVNKYTVIVSYIIGDIQYLLRLILDTLV